MSLCKQCNTQKFNNEWMQTIPHYEAWISPIPCPTWAGLTSINTQDSFSSRWPGDYSPSIPTLILHRPAPEALLGSLAFQHSASVYWPGVLPPTLRTCSCRWPTLSYLPSLLSSHAHVSRLRLQAWQNYLCNLNRLSQQTLTNALMALVYAVTEALTTVQK